MIQLIGFQPVFGGVLQVHRLLQNHCRKADLAVGLNFFYLGEESWELLSNLQIIVRKI